MNLVLQTTEPCPTRRTEHRLYAETVSDISSRT